MRFSTSIAVFCLLAVSPAWSAEELSAGDSVAGRVFALRSCSDCHAIESRDRSLLSLSGAPDFRAVANAKTTTPLGLNVFLQSEHRNMPNYIIAEDDRRNVVAYIMSLRTPRRTTPNAPGGR